MPFTVALAPSRFPVEPRKCGGGIAPNRSGDCGGGMCNISSGTSRHRRSIAPDIPHHRRRRRDWIVAPEMGTVPEERRTRRRRSPGAAANTMVSHCR